MRTPKWTGAVYRLIAGIGLVAVCFASPAGAHHIANGATKRAILESLKFGRGPVNNGHDCHTRAVPCWRVVVSGNWATAVDVGPGNGGAVEWTYIDHNTRGRWHYVGGWGEGFLFPCAKKGMRSQTARDLKIPCR